jgi:hypothetical protein
VFSHPMLLLLTIVLATVSAGCRGSSDRSARPTATQLAASMPAGARIDELVYADLAGDGREVALVAASVPAGGLRHLQAVIFAPERDGRYGQVLRRRLQGETWLPIQVGRVADDAPVAAVFAARAGRGDNLAYVVVMARARGLAVTLENTGLLQGGIRFVHEGLLESRGDVDRLLRWVGSGWSAEELGSQYAPPLPADTLTITYTVDAVRGPMVDGARAVWVRVGQYLFLRRLDRGEPSRVQIVGPTDAYTIGADGVIRFVRPQTLEVHIEGPAYSGRTFVISVRVAP